MGVPVEVEGLSKSFRVPVREGGLRASAASLFRREHRLVEAVDDVSFTIAPGEIVGFLGPNGAGKTTTLKILSGLLSPTAGSARVLGFEPFQRDAEFLRRTTLLMGNRNQLQWELPAIDSFDLHRTVYRIPRPDFTRVRDELIDLLDLGGLIDKPVRNLSLGERMKVEIADALLHQPEVMFLDEPTLGLDVTMQRRIRDFFADYNARTGASIMSGRSWLASRVARWPATPRVGLLRTTWRGRWCGCSPRSARRRTGSTGCNRDGCRRSSCGPSIPCTTTWPRGSGSPSRDR